MHFALAPIAGVSDQGGEQLQFQRKIGGRRAGAGVKAFGRGGEVRADLMASQQALQIILTMLAKAAAAQHAGHFGGEGLILGIQHFAAIDGQRHQHLIMRQIGVFEVEADAIGKADLADAQHRLGYIAGDRARRAEIGIGKGGCDGGFGGRQRRFHRGLPHGAQGLGAALGCAAAVVADQRSAQRYGFEFERGQHHVGRDGRRKGVEAGEVVGWARRHDVVAGGGEAVLQQGAAGLRIGGGGGMFGGGAGVGELLCDFGRREALFERAAVFERGGG